MRKIIAIIGAVLVCAGCANRGIGPQGGPRDSVPPTPVRSVPENGALEFTGKKIDVTFSEYLQLDNISQNLLMSPPQQHAPEVKANGKHLVVLFEDTLKPNTTYTLDFGHAVCDFTERNPLPNYTFAFSTGPVIDTLQLSGYVFDAQNLNPLKGITVGVYANLEDSAFTRLPFDRIGRTDTVGAFRIGNMQEGVYRLYAVDDISRDYRLTIGESLAYADEPVMPEVATDSALTLWLFSPQQQRLYLQRTQREKQHKIIIPFSATPDSMPEIRPLTDSLSYYITYNAKRDTVTMWLTDSASILQDSLFLEVRFRRTDSLYHLEWAMDTVRAIWRAPRMSAKMQQLMLKRQRERKVDLRSNARTGFEIYDTLRLVSTTPLKDFMADSMHLYERIDTILKPVAFKIAPTDTLPIQLYLLASLKAGKKYELQVDSAALHDVYGAPNKMEKYTLQVKTPEDYSTLRVKLNPYLPKARIQLLNARDEVVRELPADPAGAFFRYLKPEVYYLRLYLDMNGDKKWTTGSWEEYRQPEPVFYFPAKLQTKPNWDFEEEWDYLALPQTKAKPAELIRASSKKK